MVAKDSLQPTNCSLLRVNVPLKDGQQNANDAALVSSRGQSMVLQLDRSGLDQTLIDPEGEWLLSCSHGNQVETQKAQLISLSPKGEAELLITASESHAATRRSDRVELLVQIRSWSGGQNWMRLHNVNQQKITLSGGGIRFLSAEQYDSNQQIGIEFSLQQKSCPPFHFDARVMSCSPVGSDFQIVAEFLDLKPGDHDRLETLFITRHFHQMGQRVRLLGSVFSPSLDASPEDAKH